MTTATLRHQAQWQPTPPGGMGFGALLALLAHGVLIAALAIGVSWHTSSSDVVMSAELWSAVPEVAAPAPVEAPQPKPQPKPEPPKPDPQLERQRQEAQIAIEREKERKKKLEQEQEEKEKEKAKKEREEKAKKEKLEDEKRKKEREEKLAKQREENLERIRGLAGASGPATATGTSTRDAAPSAGYAGRIMARIKPNIVLTGEVPDTAETTVEVKCASDGRITGRRIVKSSGNPIWEEAVLRAIDKAEVLPRDVDGRVPATLSLVFKRRE